MTYMYLWPGCFNTPFHMLLDDCFAFGLSLINSLSVWQWYFVKKRTPVAYFSPALDPLLEWIWPKNNNTCKGPWALHAYPVPWKSIERFVRRSQKCKKKKSLRRMDDGRRALTIAHSCLRLRWAKQQSFNTKRKKNSIIHRFGPT